MPFQVSEDGFLSLVPAMGSGATPPSDPLPFPNDRPIIAVYWANAVITPPGNVTYGITADCLLLERAKNDVQMAFPELDSRIDISELFVATWSQLPADGGNPNEVCSACSGYLVCGT